MDPGCRGRGRQLRTAPDDRDRDRKEGVGGRCRETGQRDPPTRLQHPVSLRECLRAIREVDQTETREHRVERGLGEFEVFPVQHPCLELVGTETTLASILRGEAYQVRRDVSAQDVACRADACAAVGASRAALSYYRHVFSPEGLEQSRARTERQLRLPILAFGANKGVGTGLVETMRLVSIDVRGGVFEGCGHYIPEEAPRALADQTISSWVSERWIELHRKLSSRGFCF